MMLTEERCQHEPGLAVIVETLEDLGSLPTIPLAAQHAMSLARDESASMNDIAQVIAQDQALASKVLQVVNSASVGLREKIKTLPLALTVLGVREIITIVLGISVMSAFHSPSDDALFDRQAFWRSSARCAYAAKRLAHSMRLGRYGSEAFVGGLVRDIGLVVLDQYWHHPFLEVLHDTSELGLSLTEAEMKHLQTTHASIGAWLAEKWSFPETLVDVIANHHVPFDAQWNPPLSALVYVAERFVELTIPETPPEEELLALEMDEVWQRLVNDSPAQPTKSILELCEQVRTELQDAPLILT